MEGRLDFIEEVASWNEVRDNTHYSNRLEADMILEELDEYVDACIQGDLVGQADALADILVVAAGSLFKLCDGNISKVHDILLVVTAANNTKSSTKNAQGKITKPVDFVGPEDMIEVILNDG